MAGKIPRDFIDRLLSRIDIVEVIDACIPLKKAGKEFHACCPFHTEKTPSFTVSPAKQFYYCFGCGAHGSAIGFLMDYEHMAFPEAVEELAHRVGLEVPRSDGPAPGPSLEPHFALLEQAANFFRGQLRSHPRASVAVAYLKGRGLSGAIAAQFGLGYAPPGWDTLLTTLGSDPGTRDLLVQNGLLIRQEGRTYDRFRSRIMFPIRDRRGRTIAFGGRLLGEGKPKYLNSPETPLFHKGRELYGLYEARQALRRIDRLLVVEGYMDVIALVQFGIRYAVATLGTATTGEHLERLFRETRELVFCFDGDRAGRDAAWKALNTALPSAREGREMRFMFLPEAQDPDTLIRHLGPEDFEQRVRSAQHLSDFLFERLAADLDMDSLDGRAHLAERARPLIDRLPAGLYRDMMGTRLAQLVGLPERRLGLRPPDRPGRRRARPRTSGSPQRMTPVRRAIAILLQYPQLGAVAAALPGNWRRLPFPGIDLLAQLLDLTRTHPTLSTAGLVERWRDTEHFTPLNKLARQNLGSGEADPRHELAGTLELLNREVLEQENTPLLSKVRPSQMTEDEKQRLRQFLARDSKQRTDDADME
jgi:DNA primase